jgi:hypothetical protein
MKSLRQRVTRNDRHLDIEILRAAACGCGCDRNRRAVEADADRRSSRGAVACEIDRLATGSAFGRLSHGDVQHDLVAILGESHPPVRPVSVKARRGRAHRRVTAEIAPPSSVTSRKTFPEGGAICPGNGSSRPDRAERKMSSIVVTRCHFETLYVYRGRHAIRMCNRREGHADLPEC